MTLALVRHGRTEWNLARRMQGRSDISLDVHGRVQATAVGDLLSRARWHRIISSPLVRATETAALIAERLPGVEKAVDKRLIERDYGEAEGVAVCEARERWPDADYPRAESLDAVIGRATRAISDVEGRGGDSIIVSHGTLLRAAVEDLTGSACPRILNGQVVLLERGSTDLLTGRFLSG